METRFSTVPLPRLAADLVVIPVFGDPSRSPGVQAFDRALGGRLLVEARHRRFGRGTVKEFLYQTHGSLPARNLLLVAGERRDAPGAWYQVADAAIRHVDSVGATSVAIAFEADSAPAHVAAVAEGAALARYRFTRFRSRPERERGLTLTLAVSPVTAALREAVAHSAVRAAAACYARDLANTPAAVLTPRALAAEARRLAKPGLRVRVHGRGAIQRLQMGALLGVARGSTEPPVFIELTYRPPVRPRRRLALVGKGVTFDSGGLSLKPADAMQVQKRDMAGGAVVLAVMKALPLLRLPVEVHGYVPATENMPGSNALKPGDVLRACNGTTIEVLNTDAEGRLVLADALAYAARRRPDAIIDFATLTGTVRTALGNRYAAIMGSDRTLVSAWVAAAADVDEKLWELPLAPEYRSDIDSRVADLKNTGEGHAGTIIGGLFLREFVGDVPWAHIDFSSTVMSEGYPCHPKGASGFGVRTALRYLMAVSTA